MKYSGKIISELMNSIDEAKDDELGRLENDFLMLYRLFIPKSISHFQEDKRRILKNILKGNLIWLDCCDRNRFHNESMFKHTGIPHLDDLEGWKERVDEWIKSFRGEDFKTFNGLTLEDTLDLVENADDEELLKIQNSIVDRKEKHSRYLSDFSKI